MPSPTPTHRINIYAKVLQNPVTTVKDMAKDMRTVYSPHGFQVDLMSIENLTLPMLMDLNVGTCSPGALTAGQATLFTNRNGVPTGDIVVYFIRSAFGSNGPLSGCAAHAAGAPAAVIAQFASRWTLAHEVGHLLGLPHATGQNQLMTDRGTLFTLGNMVPILTSAEATLIKSSSLLKPFP